MPRYHASGGAEGGQDPGGEQPYIKRDAGPGKARRGAEMGDELGVLRPRPLSDRQSVGPARAEIRLSVAGDRRGRPDLPADRQARPAQAL